MHNEVLTVGDFYDTNSQQKLKHLKDELKAIINIGIMQRVQNSFMEVPLDRLQVDIVWVNIVAEQMDDVQIEIKISIKYLNYFTNKNNE